MRKRRSDRSGRPKMASPGRPPASSRTQQGRFWAAIERGEGTEEAARLSGISAPVGFRWFRLAGGMRPCVPGAASGRYLSMEEREEIALLKAQGRGVRAIAREISRSPSTVSRELRRNAATRSGGLEYRATTAQWHYERRARRPKPAKLATNPRLRNYVERRLMGKIRAPGMKALAGPTMGPWTGRRHGPRQDRRWCVAWSPEQIAHRLRIDYPEDESMRISHEAIYQALYIKGRGALRRELTTCLRTGRALRVPRARSRRQRASFVGPEVLISRRPAEVEDRAVPGHWEGDLIIGTDRSAIGTLVERTTRYTMLLHLPPHQVKRTEKEEPGGANRGHGAEAVRNAIATAVKRLPDCRHRRWREPLPSGASGSGSLLIRGSLLRSRLLFKEGVRGG